MILIYVSDSPNGMVITTKGIRVTQSDGHLSDHGTPRPRVDPLTMFAHPDEA